MRPRAATLRRRIRFFLLERVALPVVALPLRLWVASWRLDAAATVAVREVATRPRVVVATFHGRLLHLLALAAPLRRQGRRPVVLVSPSRDGSLLAAALVRFGVDVVRGTEGSRGIAGSRQFSRAVAAGAVGIVAVDGPRGPLRRVKPGVLHLSEAAGADLVAAVTAAAPGIVLPSWDRAHLPLPGARVRVAVRAVPHGASDDGVERLRSALLDLGGSIVTAAAREEPVPS